MKDEPGALAAPTTFDLTAMQMMADKIEALQKWMPKHLDQGVDKDWEYAHLIWRRDAPRNKADWKAALLDPGTMKITNFMGVRFKHNILEKEIDTTTMNLRYVLAAEIIPYLPTPYYNPVSKKMEFIYPVLAEGVGSATTREKKYRVRWTWQRTRNLITVEGFRPQELQEYREQYPDRYQAAKPDDKRGDLYYMADSESLGLDNTLLKMAAKRAEMDAVFQLPGVAQRFSQEYDADGKDSEHKRKPAAAAGGEKDIADFMKPASVKVPDMDIRDALNTETEDNENQWHQAAEIAEQWLVEAGLDYRAFTIAVDNMKLTITPTKPIPADMLGAFDELMQGAGFTHKKGKPWRLNKKAVTG